VALAGFGRPLVAVVFERGAFTAEDTTAVTLVVAFYSLGLTAFASVRIFAQAFYALHDSRTPTRLSVIALVINTALSALLAWRMGTPGIALASTLAALVSAGLLAWTLARRLGSAWLLEAGSRLARLLAAGAVAFVAGVLTQTWVLPTLHLPASLGGRLAGLTVLYGSLGIAYLVAGRAVGFGPTGGLVRRRTERG
jgi:putative peptidoglycan lipid II flippase